MVSLVRAVQGAPGTKSKCRKREREDMDLSVPRISIDYMFMSDDSTSRMNPILVGRDLKTKMLFAHVVSHKGAGDKWLVERTIKDVNDFGYEHVKLSIRSDQEPSDRRPKASDSTGKVEGVHGSDGGSGGQKKGAHRADQGGFRSRHTHGGECGGDFECQ